MTTAALALLLAATETPPLPPGVVCGEMPRLELRDARMDASTGEAAVRAAWGPPQREGPAGEVSAYWLTCDARLWLSFAPDADRRLVRAVLLTGAPVPQAEVLHDNMPQTWRRRCAQLPRGRLIAGARVARAWGPPDNQIGSGIVRWTYRMADGRHGQVFPMRGGVRVSCG